MTKFIFVLAFLLAIAAVEKASAAPSSCVYQDGILICDNDTYPDGPG